jgi:hypothetical protein
MLLALYRIRDSFYLGAPSRRTCGRQFNNLAPMLARAVSLGWHSRPGGRASIGGPRKNPAAAAAVKVFEAKKINPEVYTLYSYAALQVIAMSAADANSVDPKKVAETTKSKDRDWRSRIRQEARHQAIGLCDVHLEEGSRRQDHLLRELTASGLPGRSERDSFQQRARGVS